MNSLSHASSLNPGSDLWVVPERKSCFATQKIDWYLNFQISRASKHIQKPISQRLAEILEKCGLQALVPQDHTENSRKSLLIPSNTSLPNRWVLVATGSDDFSNWVSTLAKTHVKMNAPSLRVFLPTGRTFEEFQKLWSKASDHGDVAVVIDIP